MLCGNHYTNTCISNLHTQPVDVNKHYCSVKAMHCLNYLMFLLLVKIDDLSYSFSAGVSDTAAMGESMPAPNIEEWRRH